MGCCWFNFRIMDNYCINYIHSLSYKIKFKFKFLQKINPHIAHIGVGIAIIGITCSSVFKSEYDFNLNEGDNFKVEQNKIIFDKIETTNEINYQALRANFVDFRGRKKIKKCQSWKKLLSCIKNDYIRSWYFTSMG